MPDTLEVLHTDDLRQWENRATDLRRLAETVLIPSIRDGLLVVAARYERMALGCRAQITKDLRL